MRALGRGKTTTKRSGGMRGKQGRGGGPLRMQNKTKGYKSGRDRLIGTKGDNESMGSNGMEGGGNKNIKECWIISRGSE